MNMLNLKEFVLESLLDDENDLVDNDEELIRTFLEKNYNIEGSYTLKDGIVDVNGYVRVKNSQITSLTNGLFEFGEVTGPFFCDNCPKLTSLKGAPKVSKDFNCSGCKSLTTLKGAPEKVDSFKCDKCFSLTSLEGISKELQSVRCQWCTSLKSLYGLRVRKIRQIDCRDCKSLKTLKYTPISIWEIDCRGCESLKDLKGLGYVNGEIRCDFNTFQLRELGLRGDCVFNRI